MPAKRELKPSRGARKGVAAPPALEGEPRAAPDREVEVIKPARIPRSKTDDYTAETAAERAAFIETQSGAALTHVRSGSVGADAVRNNCENFFGVAQVPMGLAGPIRIDGEHAKGDFYVPLATTEGTLVASYSRGMKLLSACGGAKTTVVERFMQRAPVFHLHDAR